MNRTQRVCFHQPLSKTFRMQIKLLMMTFALKVGLSNYLARRVNIFYASYPEVNKTNNSDKVNSPVLCVFYSHLGC